MEDYDYVHLQGKEEFEKTQKELLERGNIMRQGKGQLELQQLKQFERLEQEVSRPIDHDLANWTPAQPLVPGRTGGLGPSDRQLLLFYLEQCEANLTTLTDAVDAFFCGGHQPTTQDLCGTQQVCHSQCPQACVHWGHTVTAGKGS